MAGLYPAIQRTQGILSYTWMAGSGPAIQVSEKFANVFKASSAGGNIRAIKCWMTGNWPAAGFACSAAIVGSGRCSKPPVSAGHNSAGFRQ
jgi:hypothetical protein